MPALNFQKRFAAAVEVGDKTQTIRAYRKRPIEVGDKLYLYTGMRTKLCRKLLDAVCESVSHIEIDWVNAGLDGLGLTDEECDKLAIDDGFDSYQQMVEWFDKTHGTPFRGVLIQWSPDLEQQARDG